MKARILALILALCLLLTGCSALLDRPYSVVEPHTEHTVAGEDPSTLKAGSYPELLNAVLYLVSQCMEEGRIQLSDYSGEVQADLSRACLEVAKDDPLGAYAVDFIKSDYTRVLTTYEANIYITYRRTPEQVRALVNVTGTTAIRQEVGDALSLFQPELTLRVGYFTGGVESIAALVRQAYYDTPAAALGMPEVEVALYPETGTQRIVEILLTYPRDPEALRRESADLTAAAEAALLPIQSRQYSARRRMDLLLELLPGVVRVNAAPREDGTLRSTAWDALLGDGADSEGLALAFCLLCGMLDLECSVTEGTLEGEPRFWNTVVTGGEEYQLDLARGEYFLQSSEEFAALGYAWSGQPPLSDGAGEKSGDKMEIRS